MYKRIPCLLMIMCSFLQGIAQEYVLHSENPFQIQLYSQDSTKVAIKYLFADRDRDGDLDLFLIGFSWDSTGTTTVFHMLYFIDYQENIGTAQTAMFGPRESAFENFRFPFGPFVPAIGDLNADGYLDIIAAGQVDSLFEFQHIVIYLNTGPPDESFDYIVSDSFDLSALPPRSMATPEIADLDMDGDPDILLSTYLPVDLNFDVYMDMVFYAKNTGTAESPEFLGWFSSPYGLGQDSVYEIMKAGDIDGDGDMDLLSITAELDTLTPLGFYQNTPGANGKPAYAPIVISPFGLPEATPEILFVDLNLVDIDGDQDLDVFLLSLTTEGSFALKYYENVACIPQITQVAEQICEGESINIGGTDFSESGEYTITLTGTNDCDSIVQLSLDVLPVYEEYISETLCDGDVYFIGSEEFTTSGNYMVTLISSEGCDSLVFAALQFESVDVSVTQGDATLTANLTGVTYQWVDCDSGLDIPGATNRIFAPEVSGMYAVVITDLMGCTATSACFNVFVSGIREPDLQSAIHIYSNPATDYLWIENSSGLEINRISIYTIAGQCLRSMPDQSPSRILLYGLPPGVYILKLDLSDHALSLKFVVAGI